MNDIKAIIGLGNPGRKYYNNRHNIGFQVVDRLCDQFNGTWKTRENMELAQVTINDQPILLIKPQTFMNDSGKVISFLAKQGVKAENLVVVHDELELPFGQVKIKVGGSHKGHNGLRSIIASCGDMFTRIRFGISRPESREQVSDYVLQDFTESSVEVDQLIEKAVSMIVGMVK